MTTSLFTPLALGATALQHRVVMAPLTRMRATADGAAPTALHATYYGQRASAGGLIITEATQISAQGKGFPRTPGIHSDEQETAWAAVVQAVHARGGHIHLQLWHTGRVSHSSHLPAAALPVAPSAIAASGRALDADFNPQPFQRPRALAVADIAQIVDDYRQATVRALRAGFDGVEVHAANGFLIDQFLHDGSNRRSDAYGGSVGNRARFLFEVVEAVAAVAGADRVGVRLSPFGSLGGVHDSDPHALFTQVIATLSGHGLAYLHLVEPRANAGQSDEPDTSLPASAALLFRPLFQGPLIASGGFTATSAEAMLGSGGADAIAFGRTFISNPDLPRRLALGAALAPYDRGTFYGGDGHGYTDYPPLPAAMPAQPEEANGEHP